MPVNQPDRFLTLDAMRAAAAAIVVVHHGAPMTIGRELLPRGYLAVDFFFMLSGFVMTRTYERRFAAGLDVRTFMRARLRRLYPTMAAGIILGALVAHGHGTPLTMMIGVLATELLFVPFLGGGITGVFRFDGVQWSLFFELLVNVLHARTLHRMPTRTLMALGVGALLLLSFSAFAWGSLAVGDRGITFWAGVPRVLFSYVFGMGLARPQRPLLASRVPGMIPVTLLVTLITLAGLVPESRAGWFLDLSIATFAFPALILLAARSATGRRFGSISAAASELSYPLYAMHIPAISLTLILCDGLLPKGLPLFALALMIALLVSMGVQVMARRTPARARNHDHADALA